MLTLIPEPKRRPTFDEMYMGVAKAFAVRGDCSRRQIGCVIVKNHVVIGHGYNGSPPGGPSCLAGKCPRANSSVEPGSSYDTGPGACIAVHAEQNALLRAGLPKSRGATLYVTARPCDGCARLIAAAGITRIVWLEGDVAVYGFSGGLGVHR